MGTVGFIVQSGRTDAQDALCVDRQSLRGFSLQTVTQIETVALGGQAPHLFADFKVFADMVRGPTVIRGETIASAGNRWGRDSEGQREWITARAFDSAVDRRYLIVVGAAVGQSAVSVGEGGGCG